MYACEECGGALRLVLKVAVAAEYDDDGGLELASPGQTDFYRCEGCGAEYETVIE